VFKNYPPSVLLNKSTAGIGSDFLERLKAYTQLLKGEHGVARPVYGPQTWFYRILAAQIKFYRPDVLLNRDMGGISGRFL